MTARMAPRQVRRAVKRRLEKSHPGAVLAENTVKLVPIIGTHFEATMFCFQTNGKTPAEVFVMELDRPGLPHVYSAHKIDRSDPKAMVVAIVSAMASLQKTITTDPRFQQGGNRIVPVRFARVNGKAVV